MSLWIAFVDSIDHDQTTQTYSLIFGPQCPLPSCKSFSLSIFRMSVALAYPALDCIG